MSDVMSERARAQTNQTNHEINNADTTDGGKGTKDNIFYSVNF